MLRVRWNQKIGADVYASTRTFLERDNGQAVKEVIQYLLTLDGGLFGNPIANLYGRIKNAAAIPDLRESA